VPQSHHLLTRARLRVTQPLPCVAQSQEWLTAHTGYQAAIYYKSQDMKLFILAERNESAIKSWIFTHEGHNAFHTCVGKFAFAGVPGVHSVDLPSKLLSQEICEKVQLFMSSHYKPHREALSTLKLLPISASLFDGNTGQPLTLAMESEYWRHDMRIFLQAVPLALNFGGSITHRNALSTSLDLSSLLSSILSKRIAFWDGCSGEVIEEWCLFVASLLKEHPEPFKTTEGDSFHANYVNIILQRCFTPAEETVARRLPIFTLMEEIRNDRDIKSFQTLIHHVYSRTSRQMLENQRAVENGFTPPLHPKYLMIKKRVLTNPPSNDFGGGEDPRSTSQRSAAPPSDTAHAKASKAKAANSTSSICWGCGHPGHNRDVCKKAKHVDRNNENCSWVDSTMGKAYALLHKDRLSTHQRINAEHTAFESYDMPNAAAPASSQKSSHGSKKRKFIASLHDSDYEDDSSLTMFILLDSVPPQQGRLDQPHAVKVLLDTGARDDDYISSRIVNSLQLPQTTAEPGINVCPINRPCSIVNFRTPVKLRITDEFSQQPFDFHLTPATTEELDHQDFDLIIGKHSCDQLKLASILPSHFALDSNTILAMAAKLSGLTSNTTPTSSSERVMGDNISEDPSPVSSISSEPSQIVDPTNLSTKELPRLPLLSVDTDNHPTIVDRTPIAPRVQHEEHYIESAVATAPLSVEPTVFTPSPDSQIDFSDTEKRSDTEERSTRKPVKKAIKRKPLRDTRVTLSPGIPQDEHVQRAGVSHPCKLSSPRTSNCNCGQVHTPVPTAPIDLPNPDSTPNVATSARDRTKKAPHNLAATSSSSTQNEPLPTFKNCTLARLTNGTIRRVSQIKAEEPTNDTDEEYMFQNTLPPGVDPTDLPKETTPSPSSNIPTMVCTDETLRQQILDLCLKYCNIFSRTMQPIAADIPPLKLEVDEKQWHNGKHAQPPRQLKGQKQLDALNTVRQMQESGLISMSQALAWSQVLLIKKPSGAWRFCVDYRELNACLSALGWRVPNIKHLFQRLGTKRAKYFAVVDLTQGYYQISLDEKSRKYASFITSSGGLYEPNRVWMGLKTAGSYFQQQIAHHVLSDCIYDCCEVYIDDVIIFGETEEEFLANLSKVFAKFAQYRIYLNPDKCVLGVNEIEYVGHVINQHGTTMSDEKIRSVLNFPVPQKLKDLRSFLGLVNYFRDHIRNHSTVVGPLYDVLDVLTKTRKLVWTDDAKNAFHSIKREIEKCPTLFFVNDNAPITLQTDASDYGVGGYLFQTVDGQQQPIVFLSKAFTKQQMHWDPFEKEAYAIIYCVKTLDYLLRDTQFNLHTDHRNLLFLKEGSNAKVVRWNMVLAEYNYTLTHIAGITNVVADAMSRCLKNPKAELEAEMKSTTNLETKANLFRMINSIDIPAPSYKLIAQFHNSQVGHYGFEHTLRMMKQNGHQWKHLRAHIRKFIHDCPMCQKMSPLLHEVSAARFTTASYEPFARISMDTMGPLPETSEGHQFILVIIDCFTRILELYPCKSTEADEAANHLIDFISRYGTPDEVLSDRGTQFANSTVSSALQSLGTDHILSQANSKQETAIVERANKEVLRFLVPMIYESKMPERWAQYLPLVRRILITHPHSSTGIAPATLLYGSLVELNRGVFPEAELPAQESPSESSSSNQRDPTWLSQRLEAQREMLQIAERHQREVDAHNLRTRTDSSAPPTEFEVGSYVLALYKDRHAQGKGRPPNKLMTLKRGPFRVISHDGNSYRIQNLAHADDISEAHVTELQPFFFDAEHTDPFEVALGDSREFIVNRVLQHEKRPHTDPTIKREQLFLELEWSHGKNSWEHVSGLYHLPLIRDYLRDNKLLSFVPPSHRKDTEKNSRPRNNRRRKT